MSAPNPIVPQMPVPPGQGQPGGFPTAPGGFLAPAPPAPPKPIVNPELAPPDPEALGIDPLALARPVKIVVKASERMRTRDQLRQAAPFIAQFAMNGPFLQELAQSNMTVDFVDFARLVMDSVGLQNDYRLFRDMTPQEQQKRAQPSPDAQMKMQQSQQELQTRTQLMQMKVQGEQQVAQINAMVKNKQISEESARHILQIFQQEQSDAQNAPDPREKLMDMQLKAQEHGQSMQMQQQKHQMTLAQTLEKHKLDMAKQEQSHGLDLVKQHNQVQADTHSAQTKMVMDRLAGQQKLKQADETHKKKLSLMKAQPKPDAKK